MELKELNQILLDIEQNLRDIESAKEQVNSTVLASNKVNDAVDRLVDKFSNILPEINQYFEIELKKIDDRTTDFKNKIEDLKKEIDRLSATDFNALFNDLQAEFISKTREDIEEELQKIDSLSTEFQNKIEVLKNEIDRLTAIDFNALFSNLQAEFISKTREDLAKELQKVDAKIKVFEDIIIKLGAEIDRLSAIDLEKHFDKLQKTLSDVFGALNTLSINFTSVIQIIEDISKKLGEIESTLKAAKKEILEQINNVSDQIVKHDEDIKKDIKKLYEHIENLQNENLTLKSTLLKEFKVNRIITIIGFIIVLLSIGYMFFR